MSYVRWLLYCLLIFVTNNLASQQDTIPPTFTWISPDDYSIIRTNIVRLCVDVQDNENGSGINKVLFYARYYGKEDRHVEKHVIGEVNTFPYELLWNCSDIPDNDFKKIYVYGDVIDNAGNVSEISRKNIVLDRNPLLHDEALMSHRTNNLIVIDGNLNEWALKDSIEFTNNDNTVIAYSSWNEKNLYFGIKVEDRSIISQFGEGSKTFRTMSIEDTVEIFLDINHDHYEINVFPDRHFLISPCNMVYESRVVKRGSAYNEEYTIPDVKSKVHIQGTVNDESDKDHCYVVEFAVAWGELGVKPNDVSSMGLEIFNNDRDYVEGNWVYAGWTTEASNQKNPSEWGDVVFIDRSNIFNEALVIIIIAMGCTAILVILIMMRRNKALDKTIIISEKETIKNAKIYIEERYSDENLSREEVARHVGLSPPYFGTLFKNETGVSFTGYVINFRIQKAKNLLLATQKNISEITYEVGFSSQSHFARLFKKKELVSPIDFRKKSQKLH